MNNVLKSIEVDSSLLVSNIILGEILNKTHEYKLAIQSLNKALFVQPYLPNAKLLYELALAYYYSDEYKKAWDFAMAANKIYSSYGQQYFLSSELRTEINWLIDEIWKR